MQFTKTTLQEHKTSVPPISIKKRKLKGWTGGFLPLVTAIIIPVMLLFLIEGILRIADYGHKSTFFTKTKINGKQVFINNRNFGLRFFPESLLRESEPIILPVKKLPKTYRVFVLGASAAQGDPEPCYSFSRILDVMLHHCYPEVRFEIVNTSITAINSHVVLPIAKECAQLQPDLFVVFLGNNEVVGPYGAGSMLSSFNSNVSIIQAGLFVRSTRIGQMIHATKQRISGKNDIFKSWGGMEMFLGHTVQKNDPRLEKVYSNFQENLKNVCNLINRKGAQIILCTVPSNLKDSPPFASLHRNSLSKSDKLIWDSLYQEGSTCENDGEYNKALRYYSRALAIDSMYADLSFRIGRCHWELGNYTKAIDYYRSAREEDALRFRADTRINTIIRKLANPSDKSIHIADVAHHFEKTPSQGIPGKELFHEHVHMNFKGNYLTAYMLLRTIKDLLHKKHGTGRGIPSQNYCENALAYTEWDKYQTTGIIIERIEKPPFTNQLYYKTRLQSLSAHQKQVKSNITEKVLDNAEAIYQSALLLRKNDWLLRFNYASLMQIRQQYIRALKQYNQIVKQVPHFARAHSSAGLILSQLGRLKEAETCFKEALDLSPRNAIIYNNFGLNYLKQGNRDKAYECFQNALRFNSGYVSAHLNLGNLLKKQNKDNEAIMYFNRAIEIDPDHAVSYANKGYALLKMKRFRAAEENFIKALHIDSTFIKAHIVMGAICFGKGDVDNAVRHYQKVLMLDSNNTAAKNGLAKINTINNLTRGK